MYAVAVTACATGGNMKSDGTTQTTHETFTVYNDKGKELTFRGVLKSEKNYFDEETECLTRLRLFVTDESSLVYSVITGSGESKTRRFYHIKAIDGLCVMSDGSNSLTVPVDMLFTAVFGLCDIDPSRAEEIRPVIEQVLRAANS